LCSAGTNPSALVVQIPIVDDAEPGIDSKNRSGANTSESVPDEGVARLPNIVEEPGTGECCQMQASQPFENRTLSVEGECVSSGNSGLQVLLQLNTCTSSHAWHQRDTHASFEMHAGCYGHNRTTGRLFCITNV
jgi:hypothetical protein